MHKTPTLQEREPPACAPHPLALILVPYAGLNPLPRFLSISFDIPRFQSLPKINFSFSYENLQ